MEKAVDLSIWHEMLSGPDVVLADGWEIREIFVTLSAQKFIRAGWWRERGGRYEETRRGRILVEGNTDHVIQLL